jgi:16S rRNA (guanine527-N7)-methyltransferase
MERQPTMSPEGFREAFPVSRETLGRLCRYGALLEKWQKKINLVGTGTLCDLWRRHILDSAQLMAPMLALKKGNPVILDLGSGAGFPGMVLAILDAGEVHLVESNRRKCAFLREVARETETTLTIHESRIEDLAPATIPGPADIITARALAHLDRILDHAEPFLKDETVCLFLKGRRAMGELTKAEKKWTMRVENINSLSSPSATILRLDHLARRPSGNKQ